MAAQDMPPPGGFASINVERTFAKPWLRQGTWAAILVALTFNGVYVIREHRKRLRVLKIEQSEHYIAAQPFLVAEQERKFLSHLRNLREEERELMKDVPGWKLGTLYGEPVFKTFPEDTIPPIDSIDYVSHRTAGEWLWKVTTPDLHQ